MKLTITCSIQLEIITIIPKHNRAIHGRTSTEYPIRLDAETSGARQALSNIKGPEK
jgi:hypothetical protein